MTPRDVPKRHRKLYEAAMRGKSRRAAMRAFCLECVGWITNEAKLCTAPSCPMYAWRPGTKYWPLKDDEDSTETT